MYPTLPPPNVALFALMPRLFVTWCMRIMIICGWVDAIIARLRVSRLILISIYAEDYALLSSHCLDLSKGRETL